MAKEMKRLKYSASRSLLTFFLILFLMPLLAQAAWYNTSWKYRKTITIDNTKVVENLSNFPVLISITDTDLRDDAQNDGDDILFTSSDGSTKLSHEIESFNGTTGQLIAWVKVTSVSSSSNTIIFMYYGNSGASSQQDAANVWDSSYKMVQHLSESPGAASPQFKDSTSNNSDGTTNGNIASQSGKIGNGINFDGNLDWIEIPHSANLVISGNQATFSAWVKSTVDQNDDCGIIIKSDGSNYNMQLGVQSSDKGDFRIRVSSYSQITGTTVFQQNQWYFLYGIYNGSTMKVYINAVQENSTSKTGNVLSPTAPVVMGRRAIGDNRFFQGLIDEARIAYTARSTGWMNTEYNNQSSPSTFSTLGAETPLIQFTSTSSNGSEATTPANLQLSLSGIAGQNVTVDYAVTGGSATGGGTDYLLASGTATITSGNTTTNISPTIVDDTMFEIDETVIVTLSNPSNGVLGSNTQHTYTITDNDAAPSMQFSSTSSNGSEATSPANLQLSLSNTSYQNVSVDYAVTGGTATGIGTDYTLASGTATITAGSTTTNVSLTIVDDALFESNETVIVTISNPTNGTLGTNTVHTYTITENDLPTIQFSATSSSGDEGTTPVNMQLTLSGVSGQNATVDYTVTGGTATGSGTDYTLASGTATITAGSTTTNISATITDDTLDEANETIIVTISNPSNATLGSNTTHTYTIFDNDDTAAVQFTSTSSNASEGTTPANLELSLSAAAGQNVTVNYAVTGGTATGGGTDYTLASGTATITAGNTTTNISATIVDDALDESNETIIVTLSSPSNATLGANTAHTYTINDNDGTPAVQFTSTSSSGSEGTTPANLEVSLNSPSALNVTVNYAVTGGTATGGGVDYTLASGTATITAGNTTTNISATIVNDSTGESNETIIVTLSSPSNATLGSNTVHTYTITDDDASKIVLTTYPSSVTAGQWTTKYTVQRQDVSGSPITSGSTTVTAASTSDGANKEFNISPTPPPDPPEGGTFTVTILDGNSSVDFYYYDEKAGTWTTSVSADNLTGDSKSLTVNPAAANKLGFNQQPTNTVAGTAISASVTVQILDTYNNLVTTATNSVTAAIGTNPGSGTLSGTLTRAASSGVATFNDLSIEKTGTGYTLNATSSGLTAATSNGFNITPASPAKLSIDQQPTNTVAGTAVSPSVTVQILDTYDNLVTSATDNVTIAIANNAGGGTLSGTLTKAASSGVATFNDLSINKAGAGYTLTLTESGLTAATSNGFNITPAAASFLKVTGTASMTVGTTNELTITAYDPYGNVATAYAGSKSLTFSGPSNAPSGTAPTVEGINIGSGTSVNFTSGVSDSGAATLAAYKAETTTVDVTDGSIHSFSDTSYDLDLTLNVGSAANLAHVSGNNQAGIVESTLSNFFVVKVTDTYGNAVSGKTVTWAITTTPASASGQSLSSASTDSDVNGEAQSQLTLGTKTGTYQVLASASSVTGSPVAFTATGNSSAAQDITLISGSCQSGVVNTAMDSPFVVKVTDNQGNAVSGITIGWSITTVPYGSIGTTLSSPTSVTDSDGEAQSTLTLGSKAGMYKVEASCSGLNGSPLSFTATNGSTFFVKGGSYYKISLPYSFGDGNAETVLSQLGTYNPANWRLFRYANGAYVEYPSSPDFSPGLAYWLISVNDVTLSISGSVVSSNVTVSLAPGWNQIGNPFRCSVTWTAIKAANAALFSNSTVTDVLWGFDPEYLEFVAATTLDAWQGFWVYNASGSNVDFIIPYQ